MAETNIEWADFTFNPWRGCTKVSPACDHCYAETMSKRNPTVLGVWGKYGTRAIAAESYWKLPLKWNREAEAEGQRKRAFCASLADVFEAQFTMPESEWSKVRAARWRLLKLIKDTPHLDWLLLTKRPELVLACLANAGRLVSGDDTTQDEYICWVADWIAGNKVPQNVWIGTTVENQKYADLRIPELVKIPAAVRFLSVEPMLGPIDLSAYMGVTPNITGEREQKYSLIDWVICGGESGSKARPLMHLDAWQLRDQCVAAGVPFFMKQGSQANWPNFKDFNSFPPQFQRRELPSETLMEQGKG